MKRSSFKEMIKSKGNKIKFGSQRRVRTLYSVALVSAYLTSAQSFASMEEAPHVMKSCSIEELPDISNEKINLEGSAIEEEENEQNHVSFSPLSEDKVMQFSNEFTTGTNGVWKNKEEMFEAFGSFNDVISLDE